MTLDHEPFFSVLSFGTPGFARIVCGDREASFVTRRLSIPQLYYGDRLGIPHPNHSFDNEL